VRVLGRQIDHVAVANAALGDDLVCEFVDLSQRAFEQHGFDALLMIQVGVHGRYGQIVMSVLDAGQPFRQFAFVVVVHIGQTRHASTLGTAFLAADLQMRAQNIAHRLAAGRIAALLDEPIESARQLFIERNGKAVHRLSLSELPIRNSTPGVRRTGRPTDSAACRRRRLAAQPPSRLAA